MKIRNIILLAVTIVSFSQCKKDSEEPYPNENIVMDNAQAVLYFHTVFREAENAWGFIHSEGYVSGIYENKVETSSKKIIYDATTKKVTIEYDKWKATEQLLRGTIYFTVTENAYKPQNTVQPSSITVNLNDFSINDQTVTGSCKMQYKYVADSENDHYAYTLFKGSAIYEKGVNMPVIISGEISNGQYERTKGSATSTQDDDEWAYSSTMSGMIHDDPNLTYTNTVLATYTVDGKDMDGRVYFTMDCITAKKGLSQIKISGRPDIVYRYECSKINFESITNAN